MRGTIGYDTKYRRNYPDKSGLHRGWLVSMPIHGGANAIVSDLGGSEPRRQARPESVKSPQNYRIRGGFLAAILRRIVGLFRDDCDLALRKVAGMLKKEDDAGISIPNWFLRVIGALMTIMTVAFIPWSIWVTTQVFAVAVLNSQVRTNTDELRTIADKANAASAQLQAFSRYEAKLDLFDARLREFQRDFDRKFGR